MPHSIINFDSMGRTLHMPLSEDLLPIFYWHRIMSILKFSRPRQSQKQYRISHCIVRKELGLTKPSFSHKYVVISPTKNFHFSNAHIISPSKLHILSILLIILCLAYSSHIWRLPPSTTLSIFDVQRNSSTRMCALCQAVSKV